MKKLITLAMTIGLLFVITGCQNDDTTKDLEDVTVVLDWTPNTNHTGLYVALEEGYYEELGLKVDIVQPSQSTAEATVASNAADFGISYQEAVTFARAQNTPIVSIGAIIQHNTSGFAALASKEISTPADFENKKYGGWGSEIEGATIEALMNNYDADFSKVDMLTVGSYNFLNPGELDFFWVYEGWDIVNAELKGVDYNYISLGDEDEVFDYYTPIIITNEDKIENDSDLVEKFMKATKKGYEYAIENPEESAEHLLTNAPELDRELVIASQEFLATKYQDDAETWGIQKEIVWQRYMNWLYTNGFLEKQIDVTKAYTNEYISD